MRRLRSTQINPYTIPLKVSGSPTQIISIGNSYNSLLLRNTHRAPSNNYSVDFWMKFDTENFDGIQLIANLINEKGEKLNAGTCSISIYEVSIDDLWQDTLVETLTPSINSNKNFITQATASAINNFLDGEKTLKVTCSIVRQGKTYSKSQYFNHLGVFDSIVRLRNKVRFLDIVKKDS